MGLEAVSQPPNYVSREEHSSLTSQTPASFGDIPPILRFNDQVEITLSPPSGSGSGSSINIEGRIQGQLWVTEANVTFLPSQTGAGPGFELNYQSLTLHALTPASVSGDMEAHLYCQIDDSPSTSGIGGDEDEDEFGEMRELRVFVQEGKLSPLFEALSDCSALHDSLLPSGEASSFPFFPPGDEDDEEGDEEWEDDQEQANGNGNGNGEGRVHPYPSSGSSMGRGQVLISFTGEDGPLSSSSARKGKKVEMGNQKNAEGEVDQMERFLNLVEWGNVPKPEEWEEGADGGAFDDAPGEKEEEQEGEDLTALAKRLGATEI